MSSYASRADISNGFRCRPLVQPEPPQAEAVVPICGGENRTRTLKLGQTLSLSTSKVVNAMVCSDLV